MKITRQEAVEGRYDKVSRLDELDWQLDKDPPSIKNNYEEYENTFVGMFLEITETGKRHQFRVMLNGTEQPRVTTFDEAERLIEKIAHRLVVPYEELDSCHIDIW
jgi:hypothetical protein